MIFYLSMMHHVMAPGKKKGRLISYRKGKCWNLVVVFFFLSIVFCLIDCKIPSFEGPISGVAKKQLDQIGLEQSALILKCQSLEDNMALLTKKLEASEKQKSKYLKRYDDAISDKRKIANDYTNQVTNLQSKCSSVDERCSSLLKTLDSVRKESSEWKRKYEDFLLKQKSEEDEASAEIAVLKSRSSAAEASLAALREKAQSAKEEAEEWKRKYDVAAREAKFTLGKAASVQECTTKNIQLREDILRAEFVKTLTEKV